MTPKYQLTHKKNIYVIPENKSNINTFFIIL